MPGRRNVFLVVAVVLLSLAGLTVAASGVSRPEIPKGQGASCVEDTDFMRRNHMDLLKHQRDETMLLGIRTEQHSLRECVACHAVNDAHGTPVTVASEEHFCRSCHDYAAVKIDCFQCHASRPEISSSESE
jgi:predicted CXXCH cytochrome family protein